MIKLDILNLIFVVKKPKLCCTLIAVLLSKYHSSEELILQQPVTDVTLHLRRAFPAALTPDKHIVWIRVFRQTEGKIIFYHQFQMPQVCHLVKINFSEEYEMHLVFPPNNYSATICKILRQKQTSLHFSYRFMKLHIRVPSRVPSPRRHF